MGDQTEQTYTECKWQQIECDICNTPVETWSLPQHRITKHGIDTAAIIQQMTPLHLSDNGNTYEISMPEYKQTGQCPVPECNTIIKDWHGIQWHVLFWHYYDTIIIQEEGQLPRCNLHPDSTRRKAYGFGTVQGRSETQQTKENELTMHSSFPTHISDPKPAHQNGNNFQISWSYLNITR
jgi:hypothetical protein